MSRQKDEAHLKFLRQLPCLVCMDNTSTEAAHVRYAEPRAGKPITGMGIKPSDCFAVPLCGKHHRAQHRVNEQYYWAAREIDPIFVGLALYRVSGDYEAGTKIVEAWQ